MLRSKVLTAALFLAGTAITPTWAQAATGYVLGDTDVFAGPDEDYPVVDSLDDGQPVYIHGCLQDWSWCDVSYEDDRGWVYGEDIVADYHGGREAIINIAPYIGIGILAFSFDSYWDAHYRGRYFYAERPRWHSFAVEHPHEHSGGHRPHGRPPGFHGGDRDNDRRDNDRHDNDRRDNVRHDNDHNDRNWNGNPRGNDRANDHWRSQEQYREQPNVHEHQQGTPPRVFPPQVPRNESHQRNAPEHHEFPHAAPAQMPHPQAAPSPQERPHPQQQSHPQAQPQQQHEQRGRNEGRHDHDEHP